MATITKDGKTLRSNTSWLNKRSIKNEEFLSFQKYRGVYRVTSSLSLSRHWEFKTKAELDNFFEKTFGGWHSHIVAERAEHQRQLVLDASHQEALDVNSFIDSIVKVGIATQSEAVARTVGTANEAAQLAFERGRQEGYDQGYDEGRDSGYDEGYSQGWDLHGDNSAEMNGVY